LNELKELANNLYQLEEDGLSDELGFDINEFEDANQFVGDGKITINYVSNNEKELQYALAGRRRRR
jgi:hypothetical protein